MDDVRIGVVVGLIAEARIARRLGWQIAVGRDAVAGLFDQGVTPSPDPIPSWPGLTRPSSPAPNLPKVQSQAAGIDWDGRVSRGRGAVGSTCSTSTVKAAGVSALVSLGLAGGLAPGLRPGTLIVPSEVIVGTERFATDPALSELLGGTTAHTLFGGDAVVATTTDKQRLYQTTGAVAVGLETGVVARAAARHGVPFAVLRAICDPAERALPPAALTALDARGVIGMWRLLASVALHPGQLPALLALAADAAMARRSLVARVRQIALARA